MSKKKYCGKCRWFQLAGQGDEYQLECCMSISGYQSNYQYKKMTIRRGILGSVTNKDNNCKYYNWNWFGWRGY